MIARRLMHMLKNLAVFLALFISLGNGLPVNAMTMAPMPGMIHGSSDSLQNCLSQHQSMPGITTRLGEEAYDNNEPEPEPYFVQFRVPISVTDERAPTNPIQSSSFQPPDIVQLTHNLRF